MSFKGNEIHKIYFFSTVLRGRKFCWNLNLSQNLNLSLSLSCANPACNCLFPAIAFLENWTIDRILTVVLQDEKKKERESQKYHESSYEYRNSFTAGFLRVPPSLLMKS